MKQTPYFLLSTEKVLEQFAQVSKLADIVSYSSKTNPEVTKILEVNTSCLFSIHLENELQDITNRSRVVFLAQAWQQGDVERLVAQSIRWFVVDNEADLKVFTTFLQGYIGMPLNLLLRLKLKENTLKTERYYVFGMPSAVVNQELALINTSSLRTKLKHLGIHFHRKTQNLAEWRLTEELENTINWEHISIVNMGGGLPAEYANTNTAVITSIKKKVVTFRQWLTAKNIQLMIEPGRYIAAPAIKLVTTVLAIHGNTVIVDASVYNSDLDALLVPVKLQVESEVSSGEGKRYCIKGITPCSMDLFRYRVYLPAVNVGDQLVFLNAGAYNFNTEFCRLAKIETKKE